MKRISVLALCIALLVPAVHAQTLTRVEVDSLITVIRQQAGTSVFYIRDTSDKTHYTVSSAGEGFLKNAFRALSDQGYSVTSYDGKWFILKNNGFSTTLPVGYFDKEAVSGSGNEELKKFIDNQNTIVTFQNKIYDIGDPNSGKTGLATVKGYVKDVASGEPLVGVSVYDDSGKYFAQTDAYGFYKILLPVGENVLGFSGYSLEDMKLHLQVYDDGGLDVVMKEKIFALSGAVITSESMSHHRSTQMGIEKVRINVIKNVPVAFGEADVLKVVMTLPGVKSVGEASSGFNVRGGATDQNLILFNEGTIYNPSHMFGLLSAFNTDVINDIELYKSSIPAEYGGRISSVLEVRSRDGNSKKFTGSVGLGLLTSRLHLEGPIVKDKTTFILGARTTYSNWMLKLLPKNSNYSDGRASFQDVNLGISHKINGNNSLHAYGYYSRDKFRFSSDTTFHYRNINGSLKWRSNFSEKHSLVMALGYDSYSYNVTDQFNASSAYRLSSDVNQGFGKLTFKSIVAPNNTLTYGVNAIMYDLNPGTYNPFGEESLVIPKVLDRENALEGAVFASDNWQIGKLSIDAGIRLSMFHNNKGGKAFYIGPEYRISGKYSFADNVSVKAGFNTMRQYIHMISNSINISPTDTWKLSTDRIKPQDGWQAAAGFYWTVANNTVDLSLEGYYKKVQHYLDYRSGAVLVMNENLADDLIETENKAYGVELMAKKTLGKLNGWISYTYSRSLLREMEDRGPETINGGDWYKASYDKPHDVKIVANYKFTHRYSVSMNLDYSTGRPVTIPIGKYQYANGYRLVYSERNTYRIPDYFRLDLALIVEPGHYLKQLTHMSFTFGVYNVTGRRNPYSIYYTTNNGGHINGHMLSVFATQIPYINLNLKF